MEGLSISLLNQHHYAAFALNGMTMGVGMVLYRRHMIQSMRDRASII